jgi:ATP-dependent protease ClpP protease subunit
MAPPTTQIIELPKTIYINFFDGINEPKVKAFMGIISDIIARQKPKGLYFLFSSPGGSVNAGIVFYNFLRALPVEITMHNTGSVDSIGTVIFLAGSKRYAASNSSFLFHGVLQMFQASQALSHVQMVERLSILKEDENKIAGIVAARTHLTEKEVRELFHQGETKNAAFAKERGIIDDVVDPAIPSGAPFVTVNLN